MKRLKTSIGIAVADFNATFTHKMLKHAQQHAKMLGAKIAKVEHVPGTFELPVAIQRLLKNPKIKGACALGCVVKGETPHDEIIVWNAARLLADLSVEHGKPVGLGIIHAKSEKHAKERLQGYAERAVEAAVLTAK